MHASQKAVKWFRELLLALAIFIGIALLLLTIWFIGYNFNRIRNFFFPEPPYAVCEKHLSDTNAIGIVARYDYSQFLAGAGFFFYVSKDGGRTWTQALYFRIDDPNVPQCENIKSLNGQTAWLWLFEYRAFFTHNGGQTWTTWRPSDNWPRSDPCSRTRIQDIRFESKQMGYMRLDPPSDCNVRALYSRDGGKTWQEGEGPP